MDNQLPIYQPVNLAAAAIVQDRVCSTVSGCCPRRDAKPASTTTSGIRAASVLKKQDPIRYRRDYLCEFIQPDKRLVTNEMVHGMINHSLDPWPIRRPGREDHYPKPTRPDPGLGLLHRRRAGNGL